MRKFLFIALLFLTIGFVSLSFSELENILVTLGNSNLWFILLAMVVQLGWIYNQALCYKSLYRALGLQESSRRLALLSTASNFINIVAPSGGVGGMALFLEDAARRAHPRGRVAAATALFLLLDYAAFLVVLTLGLAVLSRRNELDAGEISASVLMFGLAIGFGIIIYVGSRSGEQLGQLLTWGARVVNAALRPFIKRDHLQEHRAHTFAAEIAEGLSVLRGSPKKLGIPFLHALIGKTLHILVLMLTFINFGVAFSTGTLIAGFSIAYLFLIISPTPSGVGIVEGMLPVVLTTLRIAWDQAVISTLAFRAITFWFPLALGGPALRLLQHNPIPNPVERQS